MDFATVVAVTTLILLLINIFVFFYLLSDKKINRTAIEAILVVLVLVSSVVYGSVFAVSMQHPKAINFTYNIISR